MPSEKSVGSDGYAGTINQACTLQVRAERLGKETTFGQIVEQSLQVSEPSLSRTALAGVLR